MAGFSGKDGYVESGSTKLAQITKWDFNPKSNNPAYASSDTPGQKTRIAGVKDSSGSFDFKVDDTSPAYGVLTPGSTVTLKLYTTTGKYFTVPAIIDDMKFGVDIDGGDTVSGSASFSQTAAVTYPS
jgi:hypothetical protein